MTNLPPQGVDRSDAWNRVLKAALAMPGSRIDRASFLRTTLSPHYSADIVQKAIDSRPSLAGVSSSDIQRYAKSSIQWHRVGVSSVSFVAGLPGGWWMVGTIPTDMTQFFWHVLVVLQKLAYLHGWPSFFENEQDLGDETLLVLTIFVGVMFGAAAAGKVLGNLAERIAEQIIVRLPREALTKWGFYALSKEIAKWIGIKLTKESFARALSKVIPVLSGFISGTITWISFSVMSKRLRIHLERLRLHTEQ